MDPFVFFAAEAATTVADPILPTIASLAGNFGAAGAIIFVVWVFLQFLRQEGTARERQEEKRDKRQEELFMQREQRFEDMCKTLGEQLRENTAVMRQFAQSVNGICRATEHHPARRQ